VARIEVGAGAVCAERTVLDTRMVELKTLRLLVRFRGWGLLVALLALSLLVAPAAGGAWTARSVPSGPGGADRCVLESERQPLSDGYQTTWAQIIVDDKAVRVTSASTLDGGDRDIGLIVDESMFAPAEEVVEQRTALFAAQYQTLVEEFKRGLRVRVQLRFWPTWPKTGTHSVTFSLIGFTRAYARMSDCRTP
jgi:hypothetical protein